MKIPRAFFGTSLQTTRALRKVVAQRDREVPLATIFRTAEMLDVDDYPDALIAMEVGRSGPGGEHFRMDKLWQILLNDGVTNYNTVREDSVEFLASTPWGCLVLNTPQAYIWECDLTVVPPAPSRKGFIAVLSSTAAYWNEFLALGSRFLAYGRTCTFPETLPLSGHVLANCGVDPCGPSAQRGWERIASECESNAVLSRLASDDEFWNDICAGRFVKHRNA